MSVDGNGENEKDVVVLDRACTSRSGEGERTPLLTIARRLRDDATSKRRHRVVASALALALTLAMVARASMGDGFPSALGTRRSWRQCKGCKPSRPARETPQVTFTLHSYCKTPESKKKFSEFFSRGEKEAYLVYHNYKTPSFFERKRALKMERVKLSSTEYGYRVLTNRVNFEYGFELRRVNETRGVREIGTYDSLLAYEKCTQKYGKYFNRMMTFHKGDPSEREHVFGSCDEDCSPDYVDTAYAKYLGATGDVIPTCGSGSSMRAGLTEDARLLTLVSAVLTRGSSNNAKFGRMAGFRDTTYAATKERARWLVAGTEGNDRSMLKITTIDVVVENGVASLCQSAKRSIAFPGGSCTYIDCSPLSYDVATKSRDESEAFTGTIDTSAPLFILAQEGDSVPDEYFHAFSNDAYLTTFTLHEADTWGKDIDVRRIILTGAGTCGGSSYSGHCVGVYSAFPDSSYADSENEQRWILVSFIGNAETGKMIRVRVYNDNGAVKISTVSRAWINDNGFKYDPSRSGFEYDPYRSDFDAVHSFNNPSDSDTSVDSSFAGGGYGIGSIRWLLAPEMSPSLKRMDTVLSIPSE